MNSVVFETKRLVIRLANEADVDLVYTLWTHPQVMQYVGFPHGLRITREEVSARLMRCEKRPFECILIVVLRETDESLGQCLMHYPNEDGIAATDVKLLPEFWGHKFGVEVKQGLVDYLFMHTDCTVVEGSPNVKNIASIKMQEAVGGVRVRESVHEFPESMRDFTMPVHSIIYHVQREVWEKRDERYK